MANCDWSERRDDDEESFTVAQCEYEQGIPGIPSVPGVPGFPASVNAPNNTGSNPAMWY